MSSSHRAPNSQQIVVVGAHSAAMGFLSQARRFNEEAEITLLERGEYIGYVACGLAHHIGGIVAERSTLLPTTDRAVASRFRADIRLKQEVLAIDRQGKGIIVRDLGGGGEYTLPYDKLVLATGASPKFPPNVFGLECAGVHVLRTVPDVDAILATLERTHAQHVTVIGAGTIGLQAAENFRRRGLSVTVLQRSGQVMRHLDHELAALLQRSITASGVDLKLNTAARGFTDAHQRIQVHLDDGKHLATDLVLLATGLKPNADLAAEAGLQIGALGGVVVDQYLRTSDEDIYAVGDVAETRNIVTGAPELAQLSVPISRQTRVAAAHMFANTLPYRGTLGTFAWHLFGLTVASTGINEKRLKAAGHVYQKVFIPSNNHVTFFPGTKELYVKLLFSPETGKLLGAQAVGDGAEKRIDVLATAMSGGLTVHDLEYLEFAYSPHFGSPKDVVNQAGAMASGMLRGSKKIVHPEAIASMRADSVVLDMRSADEYALGTIPGALHIPAEQLRRRLDELPKDRMLIICCQIGSKAHTIQRMLELLGFKATTLMGGYLGWSLWHDNGILPQNSQPRVNNIVPERRSGVNRRGNERRAGGVQSIGEDRRQRSDQRSGKERRRQWQDADIDVRGLTCPGPIVKLKQVVAHVPPGAPFRVQASDSGFPRDVIAWCDRAGHRVEKIYISSGGSMAYCTKISDAA